MYWIYLLIFVAMVFTPVLTSRKFLFLGEEEFEALLIFSLGAFGFFLYLAKDKALLKLIKEKLLLQKQTNIITRDLSDSYSYIGELNRKFDIVKNLAFNLPRALSETQDDPKNFYASLLEAVAMLAKTDAVSLRFINIREIRLEHVVEIGKESTFRLFDAKKLLGEKRMFWETDHCLVARSPREAGGVASFLIFPRKVNAFEDAEIFKILASEALFLYCGKKGFSFALEKK